MKLIPRRRYLDRIEPHIDTGAVKILMGVRRCGKTVLLSQIRDILAERGVSRGNLIYADMESRKLEQVRTPLALYDYTAERIRAASGKAGNSSEKVYLFFDEIQTMEDWRPAIAALHRDFNCDIYLAGSDTRLLSNSSNGSNGSNGSDADSGQQARRDFDTVLFRIYPFTLSEICEYYRVNQLTYTREHLFVDYLKYGGLPTRLSLSDDHSITTYLEDIYHSILMKDIFSAKGIRNSGLLKGLTEFLLDRMGTLFSARSIHRALKEAGYKVTMETVLQYLEMLQEGMLFSKAGRWDVKADTMLASPEKYYACDIGLRNSVRTMEQIDYNKLFENIVYLEMQSRGYDVKVGKLGSYDIDFICTKKGEKVYIQVAYLIILDQIGREFGSLEKIRDNYPKYVISNDMVDMSRKGIRHLNIMDFLLE